MTTHGVKYIGSKASLVGQILNFAQEHLPSGTPHTLIDVFTGTTRVAQAFRAAGWSVATSDLSWASEAYAHAFVIRTTQSGRRIPELIAKLKALPPQPDWITRNYCDVVAADGGVVKMWKPENGKKGDAIRNQIAAWETAKTISHHEAMILIACLLFALDKVDSSVGVQQAYLKTWATRANNPLELEDLPFPSGPPGNHIIGNALNNPYEAASIAYLDPPYSAHSYATYYHIWDSITRWDKPAVGLKTNRRIDRVSASDSYDESMHSAWNSKRTALEAFMRLIDRLPTPFVLISYNDESLVPLEILEATLKEKYTIRTKKIPYKRNIMSQIGNVALGDNTPVTENHEVLIWVAKPAQAPSAAAP
jgi:adenine-specific DNA-methyltransferase